MRNGLKETIIDFCCALSIIGIIKVIYNELMIYHDGLNLFLGIMVVACYIYLFNFYIKSKEEGSNK